MEEALGDGEGSPSARPARGYNWWRLLLVGYPGGLGLGWSGTGWLGLMGALDDFYRGRKEIDDSAPTVLCGMVEL